MKGSGGAVLQYSGKSSSKNGTAENQQSSNRLCVPQREPLFSVVNRPVPSSLPSLPSVQIRFLKIRVRGLTTDDTDDTDKNSSPFPIRVIRVIRGQVLRALFRCSASPAARGSCGGKSKVEDP